MPAETARQNFSLIYNGATFNVIVFVVPNKSIRPLVTAMRTGQTDSFRVSIEPCLPDVLRDHFKILFARAKWLSELCKFCCQCTLSGLVL